MRPAPGGKAPASRQLDHRSTGASTAPPGLLCRGLLAFQEVQSTPPMVVRRRPPVTLTMTIVAPWGVWQCADHRLVWIERGKATDREDFSVKHLAIRCPDGVAPISYSGIGALDRKLHVSDWMRELIRGREPTDRRRHPHPHPRGRHQRPRPPGQGPRRRALVRGRGLPRATPAGASAICLPGKLSAAHSLRSPVTERDRECDRARGGVMT